MKLPVIISKILEIIDALISTSPALLYNNTDNQHDNEAEAPQSISSDFDNNNTLNNLFEESEQTVEFIDKNKLRNELISVFFSNMEKCKNRQLEEDTYQFESNRQIPNPVKIEPNRSTNEDPNFINKVYEYVYIKQMKDKTADTIIADSLRLQYYDKSENYRKHIYDCFIKIVPNIADEVRYIQGMDRFFWLIFYCYYKSGDYSNNDVLRSWKIVLEKFYLRYSCSKTFEENVNKINGVYLSNKYENFYKNNGFFGHGDLSVVTMKYFALWFIDETIFDILNQIELFNYLLVESTCAPVVMFLANYCYVEKVLLKNRDSELQIELPLQNASEWISKTQKLYKELGIVNTANLTLQELEEKINEYFSKPKSFYSNMRQAISGYFYS
ncbi:hypothetical protein ENBRE01_2453 [Enteropsectra breve]|nr:hypothetical protein ENBRE01_2453 [Enteropsectra breve]